MFIAVELVLFVILLSFLILANHKAINVVNKEEVVQKIKCIDVQSDQFLY